jgi:hypothetical protein
MISVSPWTYFLSRLCLVLIWFVPPPYFFPTAQMDEVFSFMDSLVGSY